ncbi:MAG: DUF6391 domain-containing protein [Cyanobacteria bacterium J06639_18]
MNTSAFTDGDFSSFNFLDLDFVTTSKSQDADLVEHLSFIPGLKEIVMLRQVHALEHGTVWILSQADKLYNPESTPNELQAEDNELLGGLSTEQGFYLYGDVTIGSLRRAAKLALHRLTNGESNLAVHPRCSTNMSVTMLVTAGFAVGMHLLLPRGPIEQLIGLGIATTTASEIAPELGLLAQKYLTTAIPFNLEIESVIRTRDNCGRAAHFVKVCWRDRMD